MLSTRNAWHVNVGQTSMRGLPVLLSAYSNIATRPYGNFGVPSFVDLFFFDLELFS